MPSQEIHYTLLADGPSDQVLINHLTWLLRQYSSLPIIPQSADLSLIRSHPKTLERRIEVALELFHCDVLFIHRDAEREIRDVRLQEIWRALENAAIPAIPAICVVPVHMTEAWLLFDEMAIRCAAENPRGRMRLSLPRLQELEKDPDPKATLHALLRQGSGRTGRDLTRFHVHAAARRVGELIEDFTPLRALPAFQALEADVRLLVEQHGWQS